MILLDLSFTSSPSLLLHNDPKPLQALFLPQAFSHSVPVAVPLPTCCSSLSWLPGHGCPACISHCHPAAPCDSTSEAGLLFTVRPPWSLPFTPTPWSLFSFSLSFQKRGRLCSPLGDAPTSSNSECRKETGPPSEACQASRTLCYSGTSSPWTEWDGGFSARPPPNLRSAIPACPPSGRTELVLSSPPVPPPMDRGSSLLPPLSF